MTEDDYENYSEDLFPCDCCTDLVSYYELEECQKCGRVCCQKCISYWDDIYPRICCICSRALKKGVMNKND
ncbi:MAG: hypothetical protein ACTSYG_07300 [Candidatus Heimdallarchaeota archaeon]